MSEAVYGGGVELLNAGPWVEVWVHGCPVDALGGRNADRMTVAEARTLAAGLLEAADLLESMGGQPWPVAVPALDLTPVADPRPRRGLARPVTLRRLSALKK